MHETILHSFPPQTHALTVVSDPDNLLADEQVTRALHQRGFRMLSEPDPIVLRYLYTQAQPVTIERPLIVITEHDLNTLPYDLWQRGHHVTLALHSFFPQLDYPTIRQLSPTQRQRLAQAVASEPPRQRLSQNDTIDYVLRHVFHCTSDDLSSPAALLLWLNHYHAQQDPMPADMLEHLTQKLGNQPAFAEWPLSELLHNVDALRSFAQQAWKSYIDNTLRETSTSYTATTLHFDQDAELQDALPRLLRTGVVVPVQVEHQGELPGWSQPGVTHDATTVRNRRFNEMLTALQTNLAEPVQQWSTWQAIAWQWAQLTTWRYDGDQPLTADLAHRFDTTRPQLDAQFLHWLQLAYSRLSGQRLPRPHHLFHVVGYLATLLSQQRRIALLVLDGMSLANWLQIKATWRPRHPDWTLDEMLLLSQVPSITAVARQALISGLPPLRFGDTLTDNRNDAQHWTRRWEEHNLSRRAIAYHRLSHNTTEGYPNAVDNPRTQALCIISDSIDRMVHAATQGVGDVQASLKLWLQDADVAERGGVWLEGLIKMLLEHKYAVAITSDHGHVEARGMGQPQEGITVESRSKRARIYDNERFARSVQTEYPDTVLWHGDGLLPGNRWVLMPKERAAFAPQGQRVVSHGGLTLEEMVVPLVRISLA